MRCIGVLYSKPYENFIAPHMTEYRYTRLTWQGHEFLANAKNDKIWKQIISQAEEKGDSISMFVLNEIPSRSKLRGI